jgi:hypothetical protein
MSRVSPLLLLIGVLVGCAPSVVNEDPRANLRNFGFEPLPLEERYIVAVPDFAVRAGSVRVGRVDISQEGEEFYRSWARAWRTSS